MTTKKHAQARKAAESAKPNGRGMGFYVGVAMLLCVVLGVAALGVAALVWSRRVVTPAEFMAIWKRVSD